LADEVLVSVPERVDVGREFVQAFGDLLQDRAELGVSIRLGSAEFIRAEVDL
jgi:hypothetical protein